MQADKLQDRLYFAAGVAARHVGSSIDAYRPTSAINPISEANRFLRLYAAFLPPRGRMDGFVGYGSNEWHGIFDASYTQPGDYLVASNRAFFVAAQQPLLPVLCILANRVVSLRRPAIQSAVGSNSYGGYVSADAALLLQGWPASILGVSGAGDAPSGLPTAQATPQMTVLLPNLPSVVIAPGDIVSDDLGRNLVVIAAEFSELGWRVSTKLATT